MFVDYSYDVQYRLVLESDSSVVWGYSFIGENSRVVMSMEQIKKHLALIDIECNSAKDFEKILGDRGFSFYSNYVKGMNSNVMYSKIDELPIGEIQASIQDYFGDYVLFRYPGCDVYFFKNLNLLKAVVCGLDSIYSTDLLDQVRASDVYLDCENDTPVINIYTLIANDIRDYGLSDIVSKYFDSHWNVEIKSRYGFFVICISPRFDIPPALTPLKPSIPMSIIEENHGVSMYADDVSLYVPYDVDCVDDYEGILNVPHDFTLDKIIAGSFSFSIFERLCATNEENVFRDVSGFIPCRIHDDVYADWAILENDYRKFYRTVPFNELVANYEYFRTHYTYSGISVYNLYKMENELYGVSEDDFVQILQAELDKIFVGDSKIIPFVEKLDGCIKVGFFYKWGD